MPLAPIPLDTLNWGQITTAIRSRIPADSANTWTLHAPVDPGITLLELFAWLLDQRIYWMDQPSDALSIAVLSMLGMAPEPAKPAVIALQLSDSAVPPRSYPLAAARTLMRLAGSNPPLLFTLDDDLVVLPVVAIGIALGAADRSNDLRQGRPLPLLAEPATAAEIAILLELNSPIPGTVAGEFLSLAVLLAATDAIIPPEWSAAAVTDVPPAATVTWSYTSTSGNVTPFPPAQVRDGTQGLRRSGIVRLPIASDWRPEPAAAGAATTTYKVTVQIADAHFTFPPLLGSLKANVVLARHRWPRTKTPPAANWLPLPGNVVPLAGTASSSSLDEYPPIEDTVTLQIAEGDKTVHAWRRVDDLALAGPADRVFLVDRTRSQISFGDGLNGRLPVRDATDPTPITVAYDAGGGTAGNVGAGMFWAAQPASDAVPPPLFTGVSLTAGDGGADPESLDQAQQRARLMLGERNRAVLKADYEELAITTPGVGLSRAYAAVGHHPDFPCLTVPAAVTVFVVPYAPRSTADGDAANAPFVGALQPDPGALQAARERLAQARLLATEVFVCGPVYRPVRVVLVLAVDAAPSPALRAALIAGLRDYLDPLVGGDHGDGWPFGDPVRPTSLMRVAQRIAGSAATVQSVSVMLDGMTVGESCRDVAIRPHELLSLAHLDLQVVRRPPQPGGLR